MGKIIIIDEELYNKFVTENPEGNLKQFVEFKEMADKKKQNEKDAYEAEMYNRFEKEIVGKYALINFNGASYRFLGPITSKVNSSKTLIVNTGIKNDYTIYLCTTYTSIRVEKEDDHSINGLWLRSVVDKNIEPSVFAVNILNDKQVEEVFDMIEKSQNLQEEFKSLFSKIVNEV